MVERVEYRVDQGHDHKQDINHDRPKVNPAPDLRQQINHGDWQAHIKKTRTEERHTDQIIAPQIGDRKQKFSPPEIVHAQPNHNQQHFERQPGSQLGNPQLVSPQFGNNWNTQMRGNPWQYQHTPNPYRGANYFYSENIQDNYNNNFHDDIFPRLITGILGGLAGESIMSELDERRRLDQMLGGNDDDFDDEAIYEEDQATSGKLSIDLDFDRSVRTG